MDYAANLDKIKALAEQVISIADTLTDEQMHKQAGRFYGFAEDLRGNATPFLDAYNEALRAKGYDARYIKRQDAIALLILVKAW